ncbi:PAS domain S-box protein [Rhodoferax sp. WC2427]|uniref:sensor histidine kinase n=1 Tax=Rhodoferax sp. WC2427 TaxID=3234144 RepID=UPI0034673D23
MHHQPPHSTDRPDAEGPLGISGRSVQKLPLTDRLGADGLPGVPGYSEQKQKNDPRFGQGAVWRWLSEADLLDQRGEAQAESVLVSNSHRVWQLLREMPVGLVLYDADFNVVYQNRASEHMTGFGADEAVGRSPIGLWILPDQVANLQNTLRRMRTERISLHGRGVQLRRDGHVAWVQWYTTPLFEGDTFIGYLGTHTDISEELRAHTAVRAAKQQVDLLVDAAVDIAMLQLSPLGRAQSWNRNVQALFGLPALEVLGQDMAQVLALPDQWPALLAGAAGGARMEYEGWLPRQPGGRFWGNLLLYPKSDENHAVVAVVLVARDLSDRRLAEQKIRDSEALLSAIVSTTSDAILGLDGQVCVVFSNPAAQRIFGRSAAQLLGLPLADVMPDVDLPSLIGAVRTLSARHPDGATLHLEASASETRVNGEVLFTLTARDVTERVESEQALLHYREQLSALSRQLMEAEQQTNRRLAQLLHDQLGQTLTTLRISVDALRAQLPPPATPAIDKSWTRVSGMIDRGMREVRQVLVELRPPLLQEQGLGVALDNEIQAEAANHSGVALRLHIPPAMADRRWNPEVEYAVFMVAREAIGNALCHARCHSLTVGIEPLGTLGLRLLVQDDGIGLGPIGQAVKPGHLGLVGMRERSQAIGAHLSARSADNERGTVIELSYSP